MTIRRLRAPFLFAMLVVAPVLNCGSVTPGPDGGGAAGAGIAGAGTAGATDAGGSGQAGSAGGGYDGGAAGGGGKAGAGGDTGPGQAGSSGGGHDGGAAGSSGASCTDLQNQYAAAFADAQSCTVGATGQCTQLVRPALSVCGAYGCMMYVDDATTLNAIEAAWQAAGCDNVVGVACPAYACVQPRGGTCVAADGGGAKCITSVGVITTGAQPAN
jgi:hypothetical protein